METKFACTLSDRDAGFQRLMDGAEAFLAEQRVPDHIVSPMMVALDEIVSNIFSHGVREGEPTIEVLLFVENRDGEADAEDSQPDHDQTGEQRRVVRAVIADDGIAFDPLQNHDPDVSLSLDDRPIGGLGIFLVRQMMDAVEYDRDHGRNRLSFYKGFAVKGLESNELAP